MRWSIKVTGITNKDILKKSINRLKNNKLRGPTRKGDPTKYSITIKSTGNAYLTRPIDKRTTLEGHLISLCSPRSAKKLRTLFLRATRKSKKTLVSLNTPQQV